MPIGVYMSPKSIFDMDMSDPFGLSPRKKRDSRRAFSPTQKKAIWAQQGGKCAICHKPLDPRYTEYDHGKAWADGGKTTVKNGRALCANCHKLKTHKDRLKKIDKKRTTKRKDPMMEALWGTPSSQKNSGFGLF